MTDWDIQPRGSACTACRKAFADNEAYHTLLSLTGEGYLRRDLCGACFTGTARDGVISYWQGEYRPPPPPAPEPIQKQTAETLLKSLCASNDPTQSGARYILAVMLERKRILLHRDTVRQGDGSELLVYEHKATGESYTLPDPHLRLDQLEDVQRQVSELLGPSAAPPGPLPANEERVSGNL
jgi:hypothetical protein